LPGFVSAGAADRAAYSSDPRSSWAFAPGGRDAIYSGLSMEVRPTIEMQGFYTRPDGTLETNPGWSARPVVSFRAGGATNITPAEAALMNAVEATRGFVDAQNASAWHVPRTSGAGKSGSNSIFAALDRKATPDELRALEAAALSHNVDVVDTGRGVTISSFGSPEFDPYPGLTNAVQAILPDASIRRVKVDGGYIDYADKWRAGYGSGAVTAELLKHVTATPQIRAAMNANEAVPRKARANLERDAEWLSKMGVTRADIQNAHRIIGEGPGWVDRLEAALKSGVLLPALAAAVIAAAGGDVDAK
jgi:hypothetical protein